jgi:hypothetical protein
MNPSPIFLNRSEDYPKYLFLKKSIFLGDFPLTKFLIFKNSGKTT